MKKRWNIKEPDKRLQDKLSKSLGIHPIIAGVLINRNIKTQSSAKRYLECDLSGLYNPLDLKGMKRAVKRIKRAFKDKEKILIYGDYDVDGITAVVLLSCVFKKFSPKVIYYIPNRLQEGYGLNKDACKFAKREGVSLIVTVDCGITAKEEVDYLNSLGIDIIITDHHQPQDSLPKAHSIIDPLQPGCNYPFKYLAGVGVAFKLAQGILGEFLEEPLLYLRPHLDLVALGTISDIVPLLEENRIFIKHGLKELNQTKKIGLQSLINISNLDNKIISSRHIGYILGPRINASGRLGSADAAVKLLLTDDLQEANALAKLLNDGNRHRQKIQEKTFKEALSLVQKDVNFKDHRVIVLHDDWHPGVIGIVASKLVEKYYRPTIIISTREEIAKGSGRSIENFHLLEAVKECSRFLHSFGGHKKACGITILKDEIPHFKDMINEIAHNVLSAEDLFPSITIDSEIPLHEIDLRLIGELDRLSPFGLQNPKPVFSSSNLYLKDTPRTLKRNGIKLLLTDGKVTHEAVGFSIEDVDLDSLRGRNINLAYTPTLNTYQGMDYITLQIKDIKIEK